MPTPFTHNPPVFQAKRSKEKEVHDETYALEEYLTMEEELTNAQDAVNSNIRDVTMR